MLDKKKLIFSSTFKEATKSNPIVLTDVGARGDLVEPWLSLDAEQLFVVGFEPDAEECNRLNALQISNRFYAPKALWSEEGEVEFHLGKDPSTSSVRPPNFNLIEKYEEKHWKSRITEKRVSVPCTTLDKILAEKDLSCDFLKMDTHGSEYEILQGAKGTLKSDLFGVLIETWTSEVHQGQYMTGEILSFMSKMGFSLFDLGTAASWQRQVSSNMGLSNKSQIIGLDLLFFRNSDIWSSGDPSTIKVLKAAAIADVYGFADYAIELLELESERCPDQKETLAKAKEEIVQSNRAQSKFHSKLKRKLLRTIGVNVEKYPSLHY